MIQVIDRKQIMQEWDSWRKYIAGGGKGSWPRDAFEALLDEFEEQLQLGKRLADYCRMTIEIGELKPDSPIGIAYRDFIEEWNKCADQLEKLVSDKSKEL